MQSLHGMTRRDALKLGATSALSLAGASLLSRCSSAQTPVPVPVNQLPKNVIFMVADGMSIGVPSMAEPFSKQVRQKPTNWYSLAQNPSNISRGWFETYSLNSMVTDSAPASSAWGSGSRVFNRVINYLPDGTKLTPIGALAKDAGRKVGIVTTATVTHATPAGFLASQKNRDDEYEIACQYFDLGVDVILGGGSFFFMPDANDDNRSLFADFAKAGYTLYSHRDQVLKASGNGKILGLFDPAFLPYTIDWMNSSYYNPLVPTLAEMTTLALKNLQEAPDGFLLQVEGARVDHAAHANDPGALLWDQLAFDDAIGVVLEFIKDRNDTLVVITTDHGNSNPGLNGMGAEYDESTQAFERIANFKASFASLRDALSTPAKAGLKSRTGIDPAEIAEMIYAATQLALNKDDAQAIFEACNSNGKDHNDQHANFFGLMGEFTGNHTGVGWTGTTHTSDLVPIMALGAGRDAYQGLLKNTDNFAILSSYLGVTHKNPSMTVEESKKFIEKPTTPVPEDKPHWLIGNY